MRLAVVLILLGVAASETLADCRGVRRAAVVKQAAVVKKVEVVKQVETLLVAPVIPFSIATAAYGVSYGAGYNTNYSADYAAVLQELKALRTELRVLQTGRGNGSLGYSQGGLNSPATNRNPPSASGNASVTPMAPATDSVNGAVTGNFPRALSTKCATCHEASVAARLSGGHAFLRGGQYTGDAALAGKMLAKILNGKMPPPNNKAGVAPVTDEEGAEISAWVEQLK